MSLKMIMVACLMVISAPSVDAATGDDKSVNEQLMGFMDSYLAVYNRRFGRPEASQQFRTELAALVNMPILVSPPSGSPRVSASAEEFTAGFEGFVSGLEKKGVVQLIWQEVQIQILGPDKALANNTGHGITTDGEVVYETVSLYLLQRIEGRWQITMFSPYDVGNSFQLSNR